MTTADTTQLQSADCESCPIHNAAALKKLGVDMTNFDFVVALSGNPNTGKSTVFNALTGLRQHTGNWPGKRGELLSWVGSPPTGISTWMTSSPKWVPNWHRFPAANGSGPRTFGLVRGHKGTRQVYAQRSPFMLPVSLKRVPADADSAWGDPQHEFTNT